MSVQVIEKIDKLDNKHAISVVEGLASPTTRLGCDRLRAIKIVVFQG
jgi:hypothetical protein